MKIRIKGDSLRLRLNQSDLRKLETDANCQDSIRFSRSQSLTYTLQVAEVRTVVATFLDDEVIVKIPHDIAKDWISTEQVGISALQEIDRQAELSILIEKDFNCLIPREAGEDEDTFPNPLSEKHR